MVIYLVLTVFYELILFLISLIPSFEGITNIFTYLPVLLEKIITFNYYLPIYEAISVVVACLAITLNYKAVKILLNKFGIDLSK